MTEGPALDDETEPISPEQARAILEDAVRTRLGEDWNDDRSGWVVVSGHDYMLRVTRGSKNMDFYVDLLGQVTVKEHDIVAGEESGRLVAWLFLGTSLFITVLIARIAGLI